MLSALHSRSGDNALRRAHGIEPAPVQCGSPVASPDSGSANMFPLAGPDGRLGQAIRELILCVLVPDWREFDAVCEITNRICDRYEITKPVRTARKT